MSRIISNIHCDNCDSLTETKKVNNVKFVRFGQEFIARELLAEVCPNCGETYYYGQEFTAFEKEIRNAVVPKVA